MWNENQGRRKETVPPKCQQGREWWWRVNKTKYIQRWKAHIEEHLDRRSTSRWKAPSPLLEEARSGKTPTSRCLPHTQTHFTISATLIGEIDHRSNYRLQNCKIGIPDTRWKLFTRSHQQPPLGAPHVLELACWSLVLLGQNWRLSCEWGWRVELRWLQPRLLPAK